MIKRRHTAPHLVTAVLMGDVVGSGSCNKVSLFISLPSISLFQVCHFSGYSWNFAFFFPSQRKFCGFSPLKVNFPAHVSACLQTSVCFTFGLSSLWVVQVSPTLVLIEVASLCPNKILVLPKKHLCRFCAVEF